MVLADITGYSIGLFIHVLAVIVAFGPTFGYGFLFSVMPQNPSATPTIIAGVQKVDRYLVNPGSLIVLLAGIYLMSDGNWSGSEAFIVVGFIAIIALIALQHGFFRPQTQRARDLAERDLQGRGSLSDEFMALSNRLGLVGSIAGLILAVTVFFMVVKP